VRQIKIGQKIRPKSQVDYAAEIIFSRKNCSGIPASGIPA
jgi:hypothetical protein